MSFRKKKKKKERKIQQCSFSIGLLVRMSTVFLIPTARQLIPWSVSHSWSCQRGSSTYPKWLNTAPSKRFQLLRKKKQNQSHLLQQKDAHTHIQRTALQTGLTVGFVPLIPPFLQLVSLSSSHKFCLKCPLSHAVNCLPSQYMQRLSLVFPLYFNI